MRYEEYAKHYNPLKDIEVDGKVNHFQYFTLGFGWTMFWLGVGTIIYQIIKYLIHII